MVDPLAEVTRKQSPYNYCLNNPINLVDRDGMQADSTKTAPTPTPTPTPTVDGGTLPEALVIAPSNFQIIEVNGLIYSYNPKTGKRSLIGEKPLEQSNIIFDILTFYRSFAQGAIKTLLLTPDYAKNANRLGVNKTSGKNEKHGDLGALTKAEQRIKELEKALETAVGKAKIKIQQTIKNIRTHAEKNKKGEEHSRGNKR